MPGVPPAMTADTVNWPRVAPGRAAVVMTTVPVTVSAVIAGGTPGTFYDLIGNDCSTADPLPDDVWATGLASANGTADLVGYAWTGAVADRYWLVLDPSPVNPPPGLQGQFVQGRAAPFPASQAPCVPSP